MTTCISVDHPVSENEEEAEEEDIVLDAVDACEEVPAAGRAIEDIETPR